MVVEPEVATEQLGVSEDLRGARVLLGGHVARLLEQREVDGGIDVAHATRVAVPVPGATEVGRLLDDAEVGDAALDEVDPGEHPGPPPAEDDDLHVLDHWVPGEIGVGPRVPVEVVVAEGLVLGEAFTPEPLGPLGLVALLGRFDR